MNGLPLVLGVFKNETDFVLIPHISPDGDSIGSSLALCLALKRRGKKACVALDEPVPARYDFLPGAPDIKPAASRAGRYVAVTVDCTDPARCGTSEEILRGAAAVVNIDHHVSNSFFGTHQAVNPAASATGEIVYEILQELDWGVTPDEAACLYTAIITDTGSFHFENTSARCFEVCAALVRAGAKPAGIAGKVYETSSMAATTLLARALATLRLEAGGRVAWMTLTAGDFAAAGAVGDDAEGIVNYARMVEGVEVGLLFKEMEDRQVRVALRSRDHVDVSRVAARFGGGGHPRAAGCTLAGGLDRVVPEVLARVFAALDEAEPGGGPGT